MLRSRFECKYLIDPMTAVAIRDLLAPFLVHDPYAADVPQHRYLINSLYLDTDDLRLCRETTQGQRNRFKLRVRSYSDEPDEPVYLEIKRRSDAVVSKSRARVTRDQARRLLAGHSDWLRGLAGPNREAAVEFQRLVEAYRVSPKVRIRYWREPYEAIGGDPVRVTFDTEMASSLTPEVNFTRNGGGWGPANLKKIILEIKFTEHFPPWIAQAIRVFNLQRQSVPKYVISMNRYPHDPINGPFIARRYGEFG